MQARPRHIWGMKTIVFIACLFPAALAAQDRPGIFLEGDARMGIVWDRPAAAPGSDRAEARIHARSRLKLKFIGETDGGLRYGAELELDKPTGQPTAQRVFIGN